MIASIGSFLRWTPTLVVLALVAVWAAAWRHGAPSPAASETAWKAESQTLIDKLRADNPPAARRLEALRDEHRGRAFAAVLNDAYRSHDAAGLAEVARGRRNELLALLDLVEEQKFSSAEDRERFLFAHATYHQMLLAAGMRDEAARYLELLKTHQATALDREAVRDDATAVLVWDAVVDPELRAYYLREREWLAPLLAELRLTALESPELSGSPGAPAGLATALAAAHKFHPLPKRAVVELGLGSPAMQLFLDQGDAIAAAVNEHQLPLDATLEVAFANLDWLDQRRAEGRRPGEVAFRLAGVATTRPGLWQVARRFPFALRLNDDAPRDAEAVLQQFGPDGAAELLYSNYEREVAPAARAIALYGERGWSVLVRYAGDERLRALLQRSDVGPRAVPFMAKFGDEGLDRMESDVAWLDRYFEADGREKGPQWWAAVPLVGAPAQVATNWANGHPSEWSELGWAALDVADATLLVMSFGGSATATASKEAAKQSAKAAVHKAGRLAASRSLAGSRAAARAVSTSLLRRFATALATSSVGVAARQAARVVTTPIRVIWSGIKRAFDAWRAIPAAQKRLIYRGLFALGLTITIVNRTIPMTREAISLGLQKVQKWAADAKDLMIARPLAELEKLLGTTGVAKAAWTLDLFFAAGLAGLLYVLYRTVRGTKPWRGRSLSYV